MTESCVLISINSKNSIPGPKFCLKSFNQIISNGAQQNDPQQHSKTQSGGKLNGIKYFHFLPTETIAQKTLLILCVHLICILLVNLTVPHLHSSRKIQTPNHSFFIHTSIVHVFKDHFYTCITQASFYQCPMDLLQVYVHGPQK